MSFSAASKCPFVAQASSNFLQKSGASLGMYGQKCPVISKLFHTAASRATIGNGKQPLTLGEERETVKVQSPVVYFCGLI